MAQIESARERSPEENQHPSSVRLEDFARLPFFGMWADREDIRDSTAWVRERRGQWHQRSSRTD